MGGNCYFLQVSARLVEGVDVALQWLNRDKDLLSVQCFRGLSAAQLGIACSAIGDFMNRSLGFN